LEWQSATPVLVTTTKGNKQMAVGTPKATGRRPALLTPVGFAAASALEQILAAIVGAERKMEAKVAVLKAKMMKGMNALAADAERRKVRPSVRLLADAEERQKSMAVKLLATEGMEAEMLQKKQWGVKGWDLAGLMKNRRKEIGEVRCAVDRIAEEIANIVVEMLLAAPVWHTDGSNGNGSNGMGSNGRGPWSRRLGILP